MQEVSTASCTKPPLNYSFIFDNKITFKFSPEQVKYLPTLNNRLKEFSGDEPSLIPVHGSPSFDSLFHLKRALEAAIECQNQPNVLKNCIEYLKKLSSFQLTELMSVAHYFDATFLLSLCAQIIMETLFKNNSMAQDDFQLLENNEGKSEEHQLLLTNLRFYMNEGVILFLCVSNEKQENQIVMLTEPTIQQSALLRISQKTENDEGFNTLSRSMNLENILLIEEFCIFKKSLDPELTVENQNEYLTKFIINKIQNEKNFFKIVELYYDADYLGIQFLHELLENFIIKSFSFTNINDRWQLLKHGPTHLPCSVFFSPTENYLVSISAKTAKVWDLDTNQCIHTFQDADYFTKVLFSPCGRYLILGTHRTVKIWDFVHKKFIRVLNQNTTLKLLHYIENNLIVKINNNLCAWNVETNTVETLFENITQLFSLQGNTIVIQRGTTLEVYSLISNCITSITTVDLITPISALHLSNDAQHLIIYNNFQLLLWNIAEKKTTHQYTINIQTLQRGLSYIQISPNNNYLLLQTKYNYTTQQNDNIFHWIQFDTTLYDLKSYEKLKTITNSTDSSKEGISYPSFSPDGKYCAFGTKGDLTVLDLESRTCMNPDLAIPLGLFSRNETISTQFSPRQNFVACRVNSQIGVFPLYGKERTNNLVLKFLENSYREYKQGNKLDITNNSEFARSYNALSKQSQELLDPYLQNRLSSDKIKKQRNCKIS